MDRIRATSTKYDQYVVVDYMNGATVIFKIKTTRKASENKIIRYLIKYKDFNALSDTVYFTESPKSIKLAL